MNDRFASQSEPSSELARLRARVAEVEQELADLSAAKCAECALRLLVDHSTTAACRIGPEGQFLYVNEAACRLTGYSRQELLGMSVHDLAGHREGAHWPHMWGQLKSQGVAAADLRCRARGGGEFHVEMFSVRAGNGDLLAFLQDVTARKKAEARVGEAEQRCRQLVEHANDGIYILQDERLRFANAAFARMLGRDAEELTDASMERIVPPDVLAAMRARYEQRMRGKGEIAPHAALYRHKDGRVVHAEYTGCVIEFGGRPAVMHIVRDVSERERMERELRESNEAVLALLNTATDSMFLLDVDLNIIACNEIGARRFQSTPDRIVGKKILDFYSPQAARQRQANVNAMLASRQPLRFVAEHGDRVFDHHLLPVTDPAGRVYRIALFAWDITEPKRAEDLLRVQHDLAVALSRTTSLRDALRLILDALACVEGFDGCGAYVVDPGTGDLCLKYHRGLSEEFLACVSVFPADSRAVSRVRGTAPIYGPLSDLEPDLRAAAQREGYRVAAILPVVHQDQTIACLSLASRRMDDVPENTRRVLEAIAAQAAGAIARLRAEEVLRASEERLRAIANHTFNWENWYGADGRLLWVSPAVEEMIGYTVGELMAMPDYPLPLVHEADRDSVASERERARKGGSRQDLSVRIVCKDGSVMWCSASWRPVRDPQGRFVGYRSSILDVTAQREAEILAQERQTELVHATRVSAVGEMVSSLAHELNQPLGALCSYSDACRRMFREGRQEDVKETIEKISAQAWWASKIIHRVQDFIRKQGPCRIALDVNKLARETLLLAEAEARFAGARVTTNLEEDLPGLFGDPVEIQQVILNLVCNALDAIREVPGGIRRVDVETRRGTDGDVLIGVHDTGVGLTDEVKQRMGEPFFTTKAKGTGLGLAICRSIVEAHGGRLWAVGREPRGASFYVSLPVGEDQSNGE